MTCHQCGSKTAVKDCRSQGDSKTRRRVCFDCGYKFNTIEIDMDYYLKLMPVDTEAMKHRK